MSNDESYRLNQKDCQTRWGKKNPDYWKRYREEHPRYTEKNREKQRVRNRIKRGQPSTESIFTRIANMDVERFEKPILSGRYELIPCGGDKIAKMDSVIVEIKELSVGYD